MPINGIRLTFDRHWDRDVVLIGECGVVHQISNVRIAIVPGGTSEIRPYLRRFAAIRVQGGERYVQREIKRLGRKIIRAWGLNRVLVVRSYRLHLRAERLRVGVRTCEYSYYTIYDFFAHSLRFCSYNSNCTRLSAVTIT